MPDPKNIDELLRAAVERARSTRVLPESTYRLQFHAGFKFADATAIIPYLSKLGITHVYASPYLKAAPGSTHGYDVIDHCQLNPELGTTADYHAFLAALSQHGLGHIVDMVPNHVGIATNENVWWNDVLENGQASIYAKYFDINWEGSPQTDLKGRVLLATLGSTYGDELEQGNLRLLFDNAAFVAAYHDRRFPLSPRTWPRILGGDVGSINVSESALAEFRSIVHACEQLPDRCEGSAGAVERHRAKEELKRRLSKLTAENEAIRSFMAKNVDAFNGTPGVPRSFDQLDDLLRHQCFRLASWKTAPDEINYRRFFDVNDLAALAMERLEVFEATHGFILGLLAKHHIAGLRIDHPDGLYDPRTYFRRLQTHYLLAVAREIAAASIPLSPAAGTAAFRSEAQARRGEGRDEGSVALDGGLAPDAHSAIATRPYPNPPPEYQGRGQDDSPNVPRLLDSQWNELEPLLLDRINLLVGESSHTEEAPPLPSSPGIPGEDRGGGRVRTGTPLPTSAPTRALPPSTMAEEKSASFLDADNTPDLYILAEKILALDESIPDTWPIHGTSGYDFLNMTNGLFVDADSAGAFDQLYREWTGIDAACADLVYEKKKLILEISLASEVNMLAAELKRIAERSRYGIDFSFHGLSAALKEVVACFPVYRSYIDDRGASAADIRYIEQATASAVARNPKTAPAVFHFIRDTLLLQPGENVSDDRLKHARHFAGKFQQLTSPVMAKGVEDTAFYVYNRLLSLNEVGGEPSRFGVSPQQLHEFFTERQHRWPHSMSTLSTHDTKRSEDVRARLNVLSEMPEEWHSRLRRWGGLNARHRATLEGVQVPDRNEEYALYQTLLGAWPADSRELGSFKERVQACMLKSMREAKVFTSWIDPNLKREAAVNSFIETILDESRSGEFLADFRSFQKTVSENGVINSLSQTLIKLTAPGVPDTYQGNELLDFSLVDPDNRRPVDFARRQRVVKELYHSQAEPPDVKHLAQSDPGRLKLHVHRTALELRKQYGNLFTVGEYLPLQVSGTMSAHLFAFARSDGERVAIIAVPRLVSGLGGTSDKSGAESPWGDTFLELPAIAMRRAFRNALTNAPVQWSEQVLLAANLFKDCPVALLIAE